MKAEVLIAPKPTFNARPLALRRGVWGEVKHIALLLLLLLSMQGRAQYIIDRVCVGAERHYKIDGQPGVTYDWKLIDEDLSVTVLPETGDNVTITWDVQEGIYTLTTQAQDEITGCLSLEEVGKIIVYPAPYVDAGPDMFFCLPDTYKIELSDSVSVTNIKWITSGDGTFDDPSSLHPTYTFSLNDKWAGSVTLTLSGEGLGNSGSCPPAESSAVITLGSMLVATDVTPASCPVVNDGELVLTASGGTAPYTYIFDGGTPVTGTSAVYTGLAPGTYEYYISDAAFPACETHGFVEIGTLPAITADVVSTDETFAGMSDGTITVLNVQGGSGSYEFMLEIGGMVYRDWQSSNQFLNLPAGTYDVYVRDSKAPECFVLIKTVIIGTSPGLTADVDHTDETCYTYNDGTITISNPQYGSGGYEFSIDGGTTWGSDMYFDNLTPGNYVVMMRDKVYPENVVTLEVVIIMPATLITATTTHTNETVAGAGDGTITVNPPSGGTGPYMYSLDGFSWQPSNVFTGLAPGFYDVYVKDFNDCVQYIGTVEILPAGALAAEVEFVNVTCFGGNNGSITINNPTGGSGVYEFMLESGGVTIYNWQSGNEFANLPAGIYEVFMRDANNTANAVLLQTVVITQPDVLFAGITHTNDTCDMDGTITVYNPTGGSGNYEYSRDGFNWQAGNVFTGLNAGYYQVFMRDALDPNCSLMIGDLWILYKCLLSADVAYTPITCYDADDGKISITNPQGGSSGSYQYSIDGGATWQSSGEFGPLAPDTYVVMMRETGQPSTQVTLTTIVLDNPVQMTAIPIPTNETYAGENDGTILVDAPTGGSGDYEYMLEQGGVTIVPWQSSNLFTGLAPGVYTVWMRDANNTDCFVELGTVEIFGGGVLTAQFDYTNVDCFGANNGSINFTNPQGGSGAYEYMLELIGTTARPWQTSPEFTDLAPGEYTLIIRDQNDPVHTTVVGTVTITEPAQLYAEIQPVMIGCDGGSMGSITFANVSGGSGNYEFTLDQAQLVWQSSPVFAGLAAGMYYPAMRDAQAPECIIPFAPIEITAAIPIVATAESSDDICSQGVGTITVSASGGTGVFEYKLSTDTDWQTDPVISNLVIGNYIVMIRDNGGCETQISVDVNGIPGVVISDVIVTHTTNGESTGIAEVIAYSPALPIQYSLDKINWQSSNFFTDLAANSYKVYALDANGCLDSLEFSVGNIVMGIIELVSGRVTDCVGEVRLLDVLVYNFDNITSFTLRVSYNSDIFEFMGLQNIHNSLIANNVTTNQVSDGVLDITYTDPGHVTVPDGDLLLQLQIRGIAPGLTDFRWEWMQCVVMTPIGYVTPVTAVVNGIAEVFANPDLTAWQSDDFCTGDSTILYASTSMSDIDFTWTHPRGIKHYGDTWKLGPLSVLDSGNYVVMAKHQDQCFSLDTVNIVVYPSPEVNINYSDTICFGNPVILDPNKVYEKYEWSTGSTMPNIIAYEAGIYWLKVTDFNGCTAIDEAVLEPCILEILIPNAFTPNIDGLNDIFRPIFRGFEPKNYRMDIFSKWGQHIFTTTDVTVGWDGTVNGDPVSPDTFVYVVSYEVPTFVLRKGLTSPITGRVTVIR